jgi:hypothetical protein
MIDRLIDLLGFYAILAVFQPYNGHFFIIWGKSIEQPHASIYPETTEIKYRHEIERKICLINSCIKYFHFFLYQRDKFLIDKRKSENYNATL